MYWDTVKISLREISETTFFAKMNVREIWPNLQRRKLSVKLIFLKVQSCKLKKALINDCLFEKYPENLAFQLFIILQ